MVFVWRHSYIFCEAPRLWQHVLSGISSSPFAKIPCRQSPNVWRFCTRVCPNKMPRLLRAGVSCLKLLQNGGARLTCRIDCDFSDFPRIFLNLFPSLTISSHLFPLPELWIQSQSLAVGGRQIHPQVHQRQPAEWHRNAKKMTRGDEAVTLYLKSKPKKLSLVEALKRMSMRVFI